MKRTFRCLDIQARAIDGDANGAQVVRAGSRCFGPVEAASAMAVLHMLGTDWPDAVRPAAPGECARPGRPPAAHEEAHEEAHDEVLEGASVSPQRACSMPSFRTCAPSGRMQGPDTPAGTAPSGFLQSARCPQTPASHAFTTIAESHAVLAGGVLRVVLFMPVAGDVHAAGNPNVLVRLHVFEEASQRRGTAWTADQPAVQTD